MTDTPKWTNLDAGPIQVKRVNDALSAIRWEANTFIQLRGTVGDPDSERRITLTSMAIGGGDDVRPEVGEALRALGEQFDWQVTKANAKVIVAEADKLLAGLKTSRPTKDERETPEERDRIDTIVAARNAEDTAKRQRQSALATEAKAKAPSGAAAIIVAILKEDTSDPMSDLSGNRALRTVAIGWRFGSREDFRQLRAAAARFPETTHLGPDAPGDIEHRDNYSMGKGNYLSDHGWDGGGSGWVVRSARMGSDDWWYLTELALPDAPDPTTAPTTTSGGVTVRPSSLGKEGIVEIAFDDKPAPEVIAQLKAHGFRWARGNRCWYGRDGEFVGTLLETS